MKIGIIGSGYVGLVTGACLAEIGHDVCCVDRDEAKIRRLNAGGCPLYEPGLAELITVGRDAGRLRFSTETRDAVAGCEAVFIAVGTPPDPTGDADLSYIHAAARDIAGHLTDYAVVATKSTVPVGTAEAISSIIARHAPGKSAGVVSNPEFLREGCALEDFRHPDRIVIGVEESRAQGVMEALYRPLTQQGVRLVLTDRRTSELIKYASNGLLAVKVSYINEISDLCEDLDADVMTVAEGVGLDARIGGGCLQPGPGYGGSCFPKDARALLATGRKAGTKLRVMAAADQANRERKRALVGRVTGAMGDPAGKTVAVLGLAFKAGTDDLREAAALDLIPALQARGAKVRAYDPKAMAGARLLLPDIVFADTPYEAARQADAVIVLAEWPEFVDLDLERLRTAMRTPLMIDFRNLFPILDVAAAGLNYVSLGRSAATARHRAFGELGGSAALSASLLHKPSAE
jgi:UDPglucose 6-dehydrogenase